MHKILLSRNKRIIKIIPFHLNKHYVLVLAAQFPSRLDSFNKTKPGYKLMVRSGLSDSPVFFAAGGAPAFSASDLYFLILLSD